MVRSFLGFLREACRQTLIEVRQLVTVTLFTSAFLWFGFTPLLEGARGYMVLPAPPSEVKRGAK